MTAPDQTSAATLWTERGRFWRSGWLVWPAALVAGFFALSLLTAGTTDPDASTTQRVSAGVGGAVLALIAMRLLVAGIHIDGTRVRVRGVWRTRTLALSDVGGVAAESSVGGGWHIPSVVALDGRLLRARWSAWRADSARSKALFADLVVWLVPQGDVDAGELLVRRGLAAAGSVATASVWRAPPNWPPAPPGTRPAQDWAPPSDWPQPPAGWEFWRRVGAPLVTVAEFAPEPDEPPVVAAPDRLDKRFRLDRQVAGDLAAARWGFGQVGLACGWLVALVAASFGLAWVVGEDLAGALAEGSIGIAAFLAGRSVVRQRGSWRAAFGWSLPGRDELGLIARWVGWQYLAQFLAGLVMIAIFPPVRGESPSNTDFLDDLGWWGLLIAVPTTVLLAPVVEELFFRGLLLRAAMRRFSFWPSAVLTSALFGSLHAPAAESVPAGVLLGMLTGVFGVVQCQLVRRIGRLGPAMGVHAVQNSISVALALL